MVVALTFTNSNCTRKVDKNFLGSAIIETKTFQISTTSQGSLLQVRKDEGDPVTARETLAIVDTIPLILRKLELQSTLKELQTTIAAKKIEIRSAESDVAGLQREFNRIETLVQKGSAPSRDRDNLQTQLESANLKLDSHKKSLVSFTDRETGTQIRIDQLNDQIRRCYILAPVNGVIVTQYRNIDEIVSPGSPVYEIANYDTVYADFFVPQPVVATLKLGQPIRVRIDYDDPAEKNSFKFIPGSITWIADEAEFTPKNIQTRESRNELVFKIRATIANKDGMMKRGLPVEIWR